MTLPNLVLIGAKKSGTTTLAQSIGAHPEVFMAPAEVHFFDLDQHWEAGVEWYEAKFDDAGDAAVIGEKTPLYLYDERVPARMREVFGDRPCVCIAVLREPTSRALSDYHHQRRVEIETRTPEVALRASIDGTGDQRFDYVPKGRYLEQIQRFVDVFGPDRVHVEYYEDLADDPWAVYDRVFDVLGVAPFQPPAGAERVNRSVRLRHPRAYRELLRIRAGRWLPPPVGRRVWNWLVEPVDYEPLPVVVEAELRELYEPHNNALEAFVGRPLPSAWRFVTDDRPV